MLPGIQGSCRLQAAEAEIKVAVVKVGPWKHVRIRPAPSGQRIKELSSRIRESQHLAALVKGLPGSIVQGAPQLLCLSGRGKIVDVGMPARDKEPQAWKDKPAVKPRYQKVRQKVVDAKQRQRSSEAEPLSKGHAHQKASQKPGPSGNGYSVQI